MKILKYYVCLNIFPDYPPCMSTQNHRILDGPEIHPLSFPAEEIGPEKGSDSASHTTPLIAISRRPSSRFHVPR